MVLCQMQRLQAPFQTSLAECRSHGKDLGRIFKRFTKAAGPAAPEGRIKHCVREWHTKHCVKDGIAHGDADKTIESFTKAVERFANMN